MFSCNKANELIIKSQDRQLSIFEKLSLNGHLAMCKLCKEVGLKYIFMRKMMYAINEKIENGEPVGENMSANAVQKIKVSIKEELIKQGRKNE
jgi:hypothetical protein